MASVVSPTSKAVTKGSDPLTTREFSEHVKYYQQAHKAIVRLTAELSSLPYNQPLKIPGSDFVIRRSDLSKYSQAYVAQLGDLRKMFSNRKKKSNRTNNQLNSLFYVSDQLVKFYTKIDLGLTDPNNKKSPKLGKQLELLTKYHMATSGILTSLISRYIDYHKLKSKTENGRFIPDQHMIDCFSSTDYMLDGEDLSERDISAGTPQEKVEKIRKHIEEGSKSAFEKVEDRIDRRTNKKLYEKDIGASFTTMMVFNNFFRVPPSLLLEEERDELKKEKYIEMAKDIQSKLSSATKSYKSS